MGKRVSHPRQELLKIEKRIYKQNQELIRESVTVEDPAFQSYLKAYQRAVSDYSRVAHMKQVINSIKKSRVVLVGDYHTLDQSQRSFVRILRQYMRDVNKKIVVGLETIQTRHQKPLNQFMLSQISEEVFIKRIGFKKHWFFDLWGNYEVVFDFLKYHTIPTFGVEAPGYEKLSLKARDEHMADQIVALCERYPDSVIFILVGDLHLSPTHLPKEIQKRAKKLKLKLPVTTLYENSPSIYWKLSQKNLVDHTLIVKVSDKSFCRMHTPPIIQQQSYLNWLYHEEGDNFDWVDAKHSFVQIVERLCHVLKIKVPKDYEDINVYTCGDLGFMKLLQNKKLFSEPELEFIRGQIESSQSYFLPQSRVAYIANVSIHHAAEEASHYLKFLLTGLEFPRSHKDAFYANVLHEAIGFFGSKLINHKRRCPRLKDFMAEKRYLEKSGLQLNRHLEYETAIQFIQHNRRVKTGKTFHANKVSNVPPELFMSLTHAIGYDLGDHLYYAFMDGKIKLELLQDLFTNPWEGEGEPGEVYLKLIKAIKRVKRPGRI